MPLSRTSAVLTVAALALGTGLLAAPADAAPARVPTRIVHTDLGPVRGTVTPTGQEFLGMQYAAAPVGDLRWAPPAPAPAHRLVQQATSYAPHCAQSPSPYGLASTSEDCLYLNVFAPRGVTSTTGLPVMVWIHGGALVTGQSDGYDPAPLVAKGVVVVTVNYRLGALGFLAHPALTRAQGGSGDYGLMDQQAALGWVQRNIGGFGGNAGNVTVFGESAGGLSVLSQVASPRGAGLFSRAIVQSGAYALQQRSQADADAAGKAFAVKAGCPGQRLSCLRSLPVAQVLASQTASGYQPNLDGKVLPQSISTALASGQFNRVPILNGSNANEWRLFVAAYDLSGHPVTAASYPQAISDTLGVSAPVAAAIAAEYPVGAYTSPDTALGAVGTDAIFACNARTVDRLASQYVPTYAYEFADPKAPQRFLPPVSYPYAAAHASEIQYLFDLPVTPQPGALDAAQQRLATTMQRYWTGMATLGSPTATGATPAFPRYTAATDQVQRLIPDRVHPTTTFAAAHHCDFWAAAA